MKPDTQRNLSEQQFLDVASDILTPKLHYVEGNIITTANQTGLIAKIDVPPILMKRYFYFFLNAVFTTLWRGEIQFLRNQSIVGRLPIKHGQAAGQPAAGSFFGNSTMVQQRNSAVFNSGASVLTMRPLEIVLVCDAVQIVIEESAVAAGTIVVLACLSTGERT